MITGLSGETIRPIESTAVNCQCNPRVVKTLVKPGYMSVTLKYSPRTPKPCKECSKTEAV